MAEKAARRKKQAPARKQVLEKAFSAWRTAAHDARTVSGDTIRGCDRHFSSRPMGEKKNMAKKLRVKKAPAEAGVILKAIHIAATATASVLSFRQFLQKSTRKYPLWAKP